MGFYKYLKEYHKKKTPEYKQAQKAKLISWRRERVIEKLEKPTNLVRARELGYKAKTGITVVRARVKRGGKKRPQTKGGRRSRHQTTRFVMAKSYQRIAEERVAKRFVNLEVLNSYEIGKDGKHRWFEVILVDPCRPEIIKDKHLKWICSERGRVFRGKTSAGKKGRGLRHKGIGAEKVRPSIRANKKLGK